MAEEIQAEVDSVRDTPELAGELDLKELGTIRSECDTMLENKGDENMDSASSKVTEIYTKIESLVNNLKAIKGDMLMKGVTEEEFNNFMKTSPVANKHAATVEGLDLIMKGVLSRSKEQQKQVPVKDNDDLKAEPIQDKGKNDGSAEEKYEEGEFTRLLEQMVNRPWVPIHIRK